MKFTKEQTRAYDLAMKAEPGVTFIGGYAGTGKTEVLARAASESDAAVLTPTNKAAVVLRDRGIERAQTYHSAIYKPSEHKKYKAGHDGEKIPIMDGDQQAVDDDGNPLWIMESELSFVPKTDGQKTDTAFVDEGSMLTPYDLEEIRFNFPRVVVFGDPFQLPPVKASGVFEENKADIFLTDVHRVALENPITRFATSIRNGAETREDFNQRDGALFEIGHVGPKAMGKLVKDGYQLISWTNALRTKLNYDFRFALGYPHGEVQPERDRIIWFSNVREYHDEGESTLHAYNGMETKIKKIIKDSDNPFKAASAIFEGVPIVVRVFPFWHKNFDAAKNSDEWYGRTQRERGFMADYAYAITAHKAQGSEWNHVGVFDQRKKMRKREEANRWFYTAVTRAKKRLVVVNL